ncbi:MAG TPA: hypothetical protein VJU87_09665, partial [Gemmatimonadaceae bacterium]|nr:hypothetical protein [Gemmatimonadaceae bacterium]
RGFRGRGGPTPPPSFVSVSAALVRQLNAQDQADLAPTPAMLAAYTSTCKELGAALARWNRLRDTEVPALHAGARVAMPAKPIPTPGCT